MLGPNLILFKFKVRTNGVLCLLDSRVMHSFMNQGAVKQLKWVATKVAKPIKVDLAQGAMTPTSEVVLGAVLECNKVKFIENLTICALNGMEAILRNTFLNTCHVDILRGGSKLRVIAKLANRFVNLEVEYHTSLVKVSIHLVSLHEL